MFSGIKYKIFLDLKNIPGWRTSRKIIVIECDDWGGIRMPSNDAYERMAAGGLIIGNGRFNKYDVLENREDLEQIFTVLESVRDKNGKPAVMTAVTIMANPDFIKIKNDKFTEYYYEFFTDTLKRYYPNSDVFELWRQGLDAGIFVPELHGRDHITVQGWLKKLREGNKDLLIAFDHGFVSLPIDGMLPYASEFRAEFFFTSENNKQFLVNAIKEGIQLFRDIFGHSARVFVPSNGIFHPEFDPVVAESGIKFLNVSNSMPFPVNGGALKRRYFITGQKGPGAITYYTRNCLFEPTDERYKGIEHTLSEIAAAFRWGKPATISTHRVNFVGGIDPLNRQKGLSELKNLLEAILKNWPEVEFMSSGDALAYMRSAN